MKVLMITVGSRGDAEPFCALAEHLVQGGHTVEIFLQTDAQQLAPNHDGVTVHSLPFTQMDFYRFVASSTKGAEHPNPRVKFVGTVSDIIAELVLPCHADVAKVAAECDWIVCSSLARPLAIAVGGKHQKKTAIVHLQPLVPTALFPHFSYTADCLAAIKAGIIPKVEHQNTYFELESFQHEFLQEPLDKMYEDMGIDAKLTFDELKKILIGNNELFHLVNAFSNALIPQLASDKTLGSNIHEVGALADEYLPSSFSAPPSELAKFLDDCDANSIKPVCVGFGSMPFDKAIAILDAIKETEQRAVLVGQALAIPSDFEHAEWATANVCQVASVPYAWLLPKCSMMVSHGGAGVLHACLRAGIPALIAPLMGDQMAWGDLVERKKIGVRCCANLTGLTKDDVVQAVQKGKNCIDEAQKTGKLVEAGPSGVKEVLKLLEEHA